MRSYQGDTGWQNAGRASAVGEFVVWYQGMVRDVEGLGGGGTLSHFG
jgi:hypothetical protein